MHRMQSQYGFRPLLDPPPPSLPLSLSHLQVTTIFPILVLLASVFLVLAPFTQYPKRSGIALGFLLLGIPVYLVFVTRQWAFGCSRHIDRVSGK